MGQELHSCVIAILADKLQWDQSKQAVAAMELKHAFVLLGITDETVLSDFSDISFYQPHLPADDDALKDLHLDSEILETSFSHRAVVLICTIVKQTVDMTAVSPDTSHSPDVNSVYNLSCHSPQISVWVK